MFIVGLTGSIGMGKTTIAQMFQKLGVPIWNADEVVHKLYETGPAVEQISAVFDDVLTPDGRINRQKLAEQVLNDSSKLKKLQSIVHPMVATNRLQFIDNASKNNVPYIVLDIPLLFETNSQKTVDKVIVVSCRPEIQKQRVLTRENMSEEKFEQILANQIPNETKVKQADFVIETSGSLEDSERQVFELNQKLLELCKKPKHD
ncbi:MAG: dephospho-CoA kinase [Hyphomonadaceae bacterium]|nr:MAG: dephospho-CoA kinase [Hyphomonadaceae bacterium]KAF0187168.1 MAG: dephospho-CoA kinase [Hyphomonadaceae bacterium]